MTFNSLAIKAGLVRNTTPSRHDMAEVNRRARRLAMAHPDPSLMESRESYRRTMRRLDDLRNGR